MRVRIPKGNKTKETREKYQDLPFSFPSCLIVSVSVPTIVDVCSSFPFVAIKEKRNNV